MFMRSQSTENRTATVAAGLFVLLTLTCLDWRSELQAQTIPPPLIIDADTTLNQDHQGQIEIAEDGITFDCNGHSVVGTGAGSGAGIELIQRKGVTITNCRVTNFDRGVLLVGSIANVFENNDVLDNVEEGFELEKSQENVFIDNRVNENGRDGFDLDDSDGNTFIENDANRNGFNGVELDRSRHNFFLGNMASNNGTTGNRSGFGLDVSANNVFVDNTAENNSRNGFRIQNSFDNAFIENTASGNRGTGQNAGDCRMIGAPEVDTVLRNQFLPGPQAQFTVPDACEFIVRPPED
jgi:parallel beta-helix repeat protein